MKDHCYTTGITNRAAAQRAILRILEGVTPLTPEQPDTSL